MADEHVTRQPIEPKHITLGPGKILNVSVPLLPAPDAAWTAYFLQPFSPHFAWNSNPGYSKLTIDRGCIEFVTTEEDMEQALRTIQARQEGTNAWYFGEYLAQLRADKDRVRQQVQQEAEHLDRIRR
jgi:hypothetical protein